MIHRFTIREAEHIRRHWRTQTDAEIGAALGLSARQIKNFRSRNGLTPKPAEIAARTAFRPGQRPHNLGRAHDCSPQDTRFQPGQPPIHTGYDGEIRLRSDGYLYVRLACRRWDYLHRELWRRRRGEIPADHVVIFLDGNPRNVRMQNLACISRAELVRRNENRQKAANTMRHLIDTDRTRLRYGLPPRSRYGERLKRY